MLTEAVFRKGDISKWRSKGVLSNHTFFFDSQPEKPGSVYLLSIADLSNLVRCNFVPMPIPHPPPLLPLSMHDFCYTHSHTQKLGRNIVHAAAGMRRQLTTDQSKGGYPSRDARDGS